MKRVKYLGAIIGIAFLVGCAMLCGGCADKKEAEEAAGPYLAKFYDGHKVKAMECLKVDSDGDGYVSCTATLEGKDGPVSFECVGTWPWQVSKWFQEGCRVPKLQPR